MQRLRGTHACDVAKVRLCGTHACDVAKVRLCGTHACDVAKVRPRSGLATTACGFHDDIEMAAGALGRAGGA